MQSHPDASDQSIADAAAEWVARRDRGLSPAEAREFACWRTADSRHDMEWQRLAGAWRQLDAAGAAPDLEAMAEAYLDRARLGRLRRRLLNTAAATLGAAAAVVIGFLTWNRDSAIEAPAAARPITENYRVIASTMQRSTLPDGSIAELNGNSRIEIDFTESARRVRLVEGEVHFVVEKDPNRPFFVTAGPVTVRAVGTAFNVRLENASVEVLVTEGKVQLERAEVAASDASAAAQPKDVPPLVQGQRAVINLATIPAAAAVAIADVNQSEITDALGWQSTRLVFRNTPLDEVVAGFNFYNTHRLTLGDVRLRTRTLTGVFRADNVDGFVRLLRASVDVKAEVRSATETVLLPVR